MSLSRNDSTLSADHGELVQTGMELLFEDQKFSGDLMTKLYRRRMSEEEMDAIFKRAEDEIIGFVNALTDSGAGNEAHDALSGFVFRLKRQILKDPAVYVEGS